MLSRAMLSTPARPLGRMLPATAARGMSAYRGKPVKKKTPEEQGVEPIGSGVPMGTPRDDWEAYGYSTRCASVVQVSDFAMRRVRAVSLPIVLGSTFEVDDAAHGARLHEKKEAPYADGDGYVYGRWGSPTNEGAARQLAALEGVGPDTPGGTMLFSSGMSAITAAMMAALRSGDHAVVPFAVYGGTHEFLVQYAQHWGIDYTLVDATDPEEYRKALQPNTKVVYTESPANPTCRLTDLEAVSAICDEHASAGHTRPIVMCDSTFATPFHQRCLETPGVDVAIHSATKYIGGHSDILAGAVTSRNPEYLHEVAKAQKLFGAVLAPLESFLLARGLRTLHVRMERHGENAMRVAEFLEAHPMIESVFYPGLPSHPDHELAKKIFTSGGAGCMSRRQQSFGGMLAFIVKGDDETALRRARRVCERLELITLAVSLGGTESLIEHPASMTHGMIPREDRIAGGLYDGLVRVSVGLEDIEDLLADLKQSLDGCDDGK